MPDLDAVIAVIYEALDEMHGLEGKKLVKAPDTILFGKGAGIDSIGLVNLVVTVEQGLEDKFGKALTLANERAMSEKSSPFRTVKSLADYILRELEGAGGG